MTRTITLLALALALTACGDDIHDCPTPDPDAGVTDPDAGVTDPDAGAMTLDAAPDAFEALDVGIDAQTVEPGTCRPHRDGDDRVSHADCRPYADRPVCDAIRKQCVAEPAAVCGACSAQTQCDAAQPGSICAFLPGSRPVGYDEPINSDQACLWPCEVDTDCTAFQEAWGNAHVIVCTATPAGDYCLPRIGDANCRDTRGGRL